MLDNVIIKQLTSLEELYEMQTLEKSVWSITPTPIPQTYTTLNHGGILLGAYKEKQMVGFIYSFPGFDGKDNYLCSHMLGILPAYRKSGLAVKMKLRQAEIAKEHGYTMMTWTFDPLESVNAYLNLHKLGARGMKYKENHYGDIGGKLNHGLPTDRIQVEWHFNEQRATCTPSLKEEYVLLQSSQDAEPLVTQPLSQIEKSRKRGYFVAVPVNFQTLKQKDYPLALKWRLQSRKVFQTLFANGFVAKDLLRFNDTINYYYFAKGGAL